MKKATMEDALRVITGASGVFFLAIGLPVKSLQALLLVILGAICISLWAEQHKDAARVVQAIREPKDSRD